MSLTLTNIQPYWASQTSLTSLIPASNVWIDLAGDISSLPYAVISQVGVEYQPNFSNGYILVTKFKITVWAATYASVDTITSAVIAAFKFQTITTITLMCVLKNIRPAMDQGNAYMGETEWALWEKYQS